MEEDNKKNDNQEDFLPKQNDKLEELLRENLGVSREILKLSKYIRKYVFWQKIFNWFKLILILAPIILAIIYLPPFLKSLSFGLQTIFDGLNIVTNPGAIEEALGK